MRLPLSVITALIAMVCGASSVAVAVSPTVPGSPATSQSGKPAEVLAATPTCQFALSGESNGTQRIVMHREGRLTSGPALPVARILRGIAAAMVVKPDGSSVHLNASTCVETPIAASSAPGVLLGQAPFAGGYFQARGVSGVVVVEKCATTGACAAPHPQATFALLPNAVASAWGVVMSTDGQGVSFDGPLQVTVTGRSTQQRFGIDLSATTPIVTALPDQHEVRPRHSLTPGAKALWTDPRAYTYVCVHSWTPGQPQGQPGSERKTRVTAPGASTHSSEVATTGTPVHVAYAAAGAAVLNDSKRVRVSLTAHPWQTDLSGEFTSITSDGTTIYALAVHRDKTRVLYRVEGTAALTPVVDLTAVVTPPSTPTTTPVPTTSGPWPTRTTPSVPTSTTM